ncbi:MAG: hypothetical protein EXS24_05105 [Pedosphaera sp.]|nr:hypothetical protein [Pedosphaera sp.]
MNAALENQATATNATNDLRPAKTIVEIPGAVSVFFWAALGAAILMAALLVYLRIVRNRGAALPRSPHVIAREQLRRALGLTGDSRLFCIAVSDIMRRYFESGLSLLATEQTTEEFLKSLDSSPWLKPEQKSSLNRFLAVCDLAKFARYEAHQEEMHALHQAALTLLDDTAFHSFRTAESTAAVAKPIPSA